jgi:hypothetical protein
LRETKTVVHLPEIRCNTLEFGVTLDESLDIAKNNFLK